MNPEEIAELKQLIEFLKEHGVGEFDLERGDLKVRLKFAGIGQPAPAPGAPMDLSHFAHMLSQQQSNAGFPAPLPAVGGQPAPLAEAPAGVANASAESSEAGLHIVKSPIVGTFYESPSPGASAFVKPGDQVEAGQVLCIIEAMKLMNEIESDVAGEIVKRFVTTGQPVEYGQQLFAVRPR